MILCSLSPEADVYSCSDCELHKPGVPLTLQSMVQGPEGLVLPGSLLEMQIRGPYPELTESESVGVEPKKLYLTNSAAPHAGDLHLLLRPRRTLAI